MPGMGSANFLEQAAFLFRNDDGVESLSEANGGATDIVPKNTNWETSDTAAIFRLRILTQHALTLSAYVGYQTLQYSLNSGIWQWMSIEPTSVVRWRDTSYYDHNDASTPYEGRLGGLYDWFSLVETNWGLNEDYPSSGNRNSYFYCPSTEAREFEAEFSVELIPGDLNVGDTIDLRMIDDLGNGYSAGYTFLPRITIIANVPPTVTNTPAATAPAEVDYAEQMTADGSNPKTWELTTAPTGATIGSSTGLIAWTPGESEVGEVVDFTVKVTGPELNTDTLAWEVTVADTQMTGSAEIEPALGGRTGMEAALGGKVEM